jgi:hypothetical protein
LKWKKKLISTINRTRSPRAGPFRTRDHSLNRPHSHNTITQAETLTFSSIKLRQPSLGTNAAIFLPFLISCTRAHLRMAELGCLASMPLFLFSVVIRGLVLRC